MQMNRKQQVAVLIMALYFVVNIAANLDQLAISDEEILYRLLNDERILVNPDLGSLDQENLSILSRQITTYIQGKIIISAVNTILLVYLFANYLDMYRTTKSSFTLGLVFLSAALLSYSLFTNPVLLSFTSGSGGLQIVQYFNFLPDLLTTMASTILIYLSRQ
ncbi:hypothetical protein E2P71_09225 [Candidatus Bathyarchaeota archaeon]|nr:hypothetical protein E2P71_09225 [Candidatus Bathyarchaeota archaeon]